MRALILGGTSFIGPCVVRGCAPDDGLRPTIRRERERPVPWLGDPEEVRARVDDAAEDRALVTAEPHRRLDG